MINQVQLNLNNAIPLSPFKSAGFSLVEILISIVVLAIGLLGLAKMQLDGLRIGHDAQLRSIAIFYAADMADRMRANPAAVAGGAASSYNNPNGSETANPNCIGVDNNGDPTEDVCSPTQIAAHDFYEWTGMLQGLAATNWHPAITAALPSGNGIVCIDSTPNDGNPPPGNVGCDNVAAVSSAPLFAIKIWWNERNDSDGNVVRRYVASFQP